MAPRGHPPHPAPVRLIVFLENEYLKKLQQRIIYICFRNVYECIDSSVVSRPN